MVSPSRGGLPHELCFVHRCTLTPGPTDEPPCPHLSYDYNKTDLGTERPKRRHSKFSVIISIVSEVAGQSGGGFGGCPEQRIQQTLLKDSDDSCRNDRCEHICFFFHSSWQKKVQTGGSKYENKGGSVSELSWWETGRSPPHHTPSSFHAISWACPRSLPRQDIFSPRLCCLRPGSPLSPPLPMATSSTMHPSGCFREHLGPRPSG